MSVLVRSADDMRAIIAANHEFTFEGANDAWYCATLAIGTGIPLRFTLDDDVQWTGEVEHVGCGKIRLSTAAEFRYVRVRDIEVAA